MEANIRIHIHEHIYACTILCSTIECEESLNSFCVLVPSIYCIFVILYRKCKWACMNITNMDCYVNKRNGIEGFYEQ